MKRSSIKLLLTCAIVAGTLGTVGCRGRGWLPAPGPLGQQQATAVVHDPYPQGDLGPTDASVRPPNYQRPLPEPVRNRLVPDLMPWLGR